MADELTDQQLGQLERNLRALQAELTATLAQSKDGVKPVDLDQPIGRLSRMDAMQQQKMAQSNRRSAERRQQQVARALVAISEGDYGLCRECEEPIGMRRLQAKPESMFCVTCKGARESRR